MKLPHLKNPKIRYSYFTISIMKIKFANYCMKAIKISARLPFPVGFIPSQTSISFFVSVYTSHPKNIEKSSRHLAFCKPIQL